MNATEIIVYRNPAEKAIWDLMSSGVMWPVFVGALAGIVAGWLTSSLLTRLGRNNGDITLAVAVLVCALTVWYMWV